MKTFKKFILEQYQQQILLEMPYVPLAKKTIDLELELRFPDITNLRDSNPKEKNRMYNTLVTYIRQWYDGYSFLYKVKDPWTGANGMDGLKAKLTKNNKKLFDSDDGRVHYKFEDNKVFKIILAKDPESKPIEKEETPQKVEENEREVFLDTATKRLELQLAALEKTKEQFITDVKSKILF